MINNASETQSKQPNNGICFQRLPLLLGMSRDSWRHWRVQNLAALSWSAPVREEKKITKRVAKDTVYKSRDKTTRWIRYITVNFTNGPRDLCTHHLWWKQVVTGTRRRVRSGFASTRYERWNAARGPSRFGTPAKQAKAAANIGKHQRVIVVSALGDVCCWDLRTWISRCLNSYFFRFLTADFTCALRPWGSCQFQQFSRSICREMNSAALWDQTSIQTNRKALGDFTRARGTVTAEIASSHSAHILPSILSRYFRLGSQGGSVE